MAKIVGTGKFTYRERCSSCGKIKMVDINGECKSCYDFMAVMRKARKFDAKLKRMAGF